MFRGGTQHHFLTNDKNFFTSKILDWSKFVLIYWICFAFSFLMVYLTQRIVSSSSYGQAKSPNQLCNWTKRDLKIGNKIIWCFTRKLLSTCTSFTHHAHVMMHNQCMPWTLNFDMTLTRRITIWHQHSTKIKSSKIIHCIVCI